MVIKNKNKDQVEDVVKVKALLKEIFLKKYQRTVTLSAGSCMRKEGMKIKNMIRFADEAMYMVKYSGKNNFIMYRENQ